LLQLGVSPLYNTRQKQFQFIIHLFKHNQFYYEKNDCEEKNFMKRIRASTKIWSLLVDFTLVNATSSTNSIELKILSQECTFQFNGLLRIHCDETSLGLSDKASDIHQKILMLFPRRKPAMHVQLVPSTRVA